MKDKLTQTKKTLKHYTPEIIVGLTVTASVAATLYFKYSGRLSLDVPKENLTMLKEQGGALVYNVKGDEYALRYLPR